MSNRKSKRKPKLPARLNDHVIEQLSQKRNCGTGNSNDEIGESEVVNGDAVEKSEEVTGTMISDNQNENLVDEEAIGEKVSDEFPPLSAAYPNSVSPLKSTNPKLTEKVNEITNDNEILNKVNNELSVDPKLNNDNVNKTGNEAKSFANTVKANSVFDNKLCLIPTVEKDGRDVVVFEEDLVIEGSKKWEHTLCGYFVGYKMQYAEIKYNIGRMWGRLGLKDIIMLNGMYLFKFKNEDGINIKMFDFMM
jgi:hypothetical protein